MIGDLKVGKSGQSWMGLTRQSQTTGAAMEKVLPPPVPYLVLSGGERWFASVEQRGRSVAVMQGGKTAQTENAHLHTNSLF